MSVYNGIKLRWKVILLQLWNCWSLKSIIFLPLRYYQQLTYWKRRGLQIYLSPIENFRQTIAVAYMSKNLTMLCKELYKRPNPTHALVGFYYNGRPAVFVHDPIVVKLLLSQNYSHNLEVLWHPDESKNPTLSRCPMFTTNLPWRRRNIWTRDKIDKAFCKLLNLKRMMLYRSAFDLISCEESIVTVKLGDTASLYAEQVFIRLGLGYTDLLDRDIDGAKNIFQTIKRTFETQLNKPRDTILLMASDLARNDHQVTIVPPTVESQLRRLVEHILDRHYPDPEASECLLFYLHNAGLSLHEISCELFAFCFDIYVHLVCRGSLALRELAMNGGIQNKLSDELNTAEDHDGERWLAQTILNLPLLNQFIHEIRNKYPLNGCLARVCKAPMSIPLYRGSSKNIVLRKGELVFASTLGVSTDEKDLDLNYDQPNDPILRVVFLMFIATTLRTCLLTPGNQLIYEIKINYDAILPENICTLRARTRPHRIREVYIP